MFQFILTEKVNGIAQITLNRTEKCNAIHGQMMQELSSSIKQYAQEDTRVLLIKGNGKHFCAGADIAWMKEMANASYEENKKDAEALADLMYQLYSFPSPTIVLAHGMTLGGGLGLLAVGDIAIAAKNSLFGFPEVKMGIIPAVISPYILKIMGERAAHFYFLTGEKFDAQKAFDLGLVHQLVESDELLTAGNNMVAMLKKNSPHALKTVKQLIRSMKKKELTPELIKKTAEQLALLRHTPEAQEGLKAFLENRLPIWS